MDVGVADAREDDVESHIVRADGTTGDGGLGQWTGRRGGGVGGDGSHTVTLGLPRSDRTGRPRRLRFAEWWRSRRFRGCRRARPVAAHPGAGDLDAATDIGPEDPPADGGVEQAAVDAMWKAAVDWYRSGVHPAMQVCVRCNGAVILNRAIGHASGNGPRDGQK